MTPSWLAYVGAITGIVGAITGVAGAVMGYVSYRRSTMLKALDLRLELRTLESDVDQLLQQLPGLIKTAKQSRLAVAAATGSLNTGAIESWKRQVEADTTAVAGIRRRLVLRDDGYASFAPTELESRLVEVHAIKNEALSYEHRYRAAIASDEKQRDHIRADAEFRLKARRF